MWILINYLTIGNLSYYKNRLIVVAVLYFKAVLNKSYYKKFHSDLNDIFDKYKNEFHAVRFDDILKIMGIDLIELDKLL